MSRSSLPGLSALLTPAEVGKVLHKTEDSLAQLRYRGRGPVFVKAGRRVLYRREDVLAYLEANRYERTDTPARNR
ncbi:helix-turn-helix domain-containing protein [Nocardia sp. CA-136227]|uniref:helix-turn-helix domain-containing protein n=1 Tax=Nocardia sp. CA-136227 TaxID=3239979 RepID=UPI003D958D4C